VKLRVYYEGACHLCSREIDHYLRRPGAAELIEFVDISDPRFSAEAEGLSGAPILKYMHARRPDGELRVGIEAFLEIWRTLPGYGWLVKLVGNPVVKPLARVGYYLFAQVRPLLPKRKAVCSLQRGVEDHARTP
jgi:predicted DCC family thiol-disulfide oxidoreductase YuxK